MAQIDIIVPLYNKEKTVARSIRSILAQTFTDWRLIVVDDGSTDGGPEVVKTFDDPRIVLLRQENQGPGAARNTGIKTATAEYLAFLDADDQWHPWYLQNACNAITTHPVSFVGSYYFEWPRRIDMTRYWQKRGVCPGIYHRADELSTAQVDAFVLFFHVGTTLVKRQTALHYGGFYEQGCRNGEDTIFFARLVFNEPFMVIGPAAVRHNRQESDLSITHNYPLNPALAHPDVILDFCPADKHPSVRMFLSHWALRTAHHKARNGFRKQAVYLLEHFPETRRYRLAYLRCKLEIVFSRWMPYWVKFKCAVGPPVRRAANIAAMRLGLIKAPPEMPEQ